MSIIKTSNFNPMAVIVMLETMSVDELKENVTEACNLIMVLQDDNEKYKNRLKQISLISEK